MTAQEYRAPDSVGRLQRNAMVAGGIALLLCIFGAIKSPQIFFPSYLMALFAGARARSWLPGIVDAAASDWRPLGHRHSPPARIGHAYAAASCRPVPSHHFWHEVSLRRLA